VLGWTEPLPFDALMMSKCFVMADHESLARRLVRLGCLVLSTVFSLTQFRRVVIDSMSLLGRICNAASVEMQDTCAPVSQRAGILLGDF
jgi:hypothetical protein